MIDKNAGTEDELDTLVSIAIRRAEILDDLRAPNAAEAWHEVMLYEEQLAKITRADELPGGIARTGAVRAALASGQRAKAEELASEYLVEELLPAERREAIRLALEQDRKRPVLRRTDMLGTDRHAELEEWRLRTSENAARIEEHLIGGQFVQPIRALLGFLGLAFLIAEAFLSLALLGGNLQGFQKTLGIWGGIAMFVVLVAVYFLFGHRLLNLGATHQFNRNKEVVFTYSRVKASQVTLRRRWESGGRPAAQLEAWVANHLGNVSVLTFLDSAPFAYARDRAIQALDISSEE